MRTRARLQFRAGWPLPLGPPLLLSHGRFGSRRRSGRCACRCAVDRPLAGGCAPAASRLSASFRPCFKLSWLLHPRPAPLAGVPLGARRSQLPTRAFTLGVIVSRCHRLLGPAFSLLAVACVSVFVRTSVLSALGLRLRVFFCAPLAWRRFIAPAARFLAHLLSGM